jgi:hypothetical protein
VEEPQHWRVRQELPLPAVGSLPLPKGGLPAIASAFQLHSPAAVEELAASVASLSITPAEPCGKVLQTQSSRHCLSRMLMHLGVSSVDGGALPKSTVLTLHFASPAQALLRCEGGEEMGLDRLQQYIWESDAVAHYAETRNGTASPSSFRHIPRRQRPVCLSTPASVSISFRTLAHHPVLSNGVASIAVWCAGLLEADDSTKMGPWLALGCVSPRRMYHEVQRYEAERTGNDSTRMVVFHLLVRDWFRCIPASCL